MLCLPILPVIQPWMSPTPPSKILLPWTSLYSPLSWLRFHLGCLHRVEWVACKVCLYLIWLRISRFNSTSTWWWEWSRRESKKMMRKEWGGLLLSHAWDSGAGTHCTGGGVCLGQEPGQFVPREGGKADIWANTGRWVDVGLGAWRNFLLWLLFSQWCRKQPDKGWGRRHWEFKEKEGMKELSWRSGACVDQGNGGWLLGTLQGTVGLSKSQQDSWARPGCRAAQHRAQCALVHSAVHLALHSVLWAQGGQLRAAHSTHPAVGASEQLWDNHVLTVLQDTRGGQGPWQCSGDHAPHFSGKFCNSLSLLFSEALSAVLSIAWCVVEVMHAVPKEIRKM